MKKYLVNGLELSAESLRQYFISKHPKNKLSIEEEKDFESKIYAGSSFEFMGETIEIIMEQDQDELNINKKEKPRYEIMNRKYIFIEELESQKNLKVEYGNLINFYSLFEEAFGEIINPEEEICLINAYHDVRKCNKHIEINGKTYDVCKK